MMCQYLRIFFFGLIVSCLGSSAFAQEAVAPHYFGIEHGVVEYEITGVDKGKETFYFDQWGMRQAHFRSADTPKWGFMNTVTINLADEILYIDPSKNLGQKTKDEAFKQVLADPQAAAKGLLSLQKIAIQGGKKTGEESVLDRPCEIWEITATKTKLWLWNGIILRSEEQTADGVLKYKALKIDDLTVIDEGVFTVPPRIRFIDRDINQILISKR